MQRITRILVVAITSALGTSLLVQAQPGSALTPADRSAGLFTQMATVLQSPRCINCHTVTEFPRQGDGHARHFLNVQRGPNNHGLTGMQCSTCHAAVNQTLANVPGAPHWGLAPLSMGWEGKSVRTICLTMLDPAKNGHRGVAALVRHLSYDPLVGWAWTPGGSRKPPPLTRPAFRRVVADWAATGARCPQ